MAGRKKQETTPTGKVNFKYKYIPVFFNREAIQSRHVLNLPEKLTPPAPPIWEPNGLDRLLSNPLGELTKIGSGLPAKTSTTKINPTPTIWSGYLGGFFTRSVGSADGLNNIARSPCGKPQGIRGPVINPNFKLPREPFFQNFSWKLPAWHLSSLSKLNLLKKEAKKKSAPQIKITYRAPDYSAYVLPSWQRAIAGFAVIAIMLVLPIKAFSAFYQLRDSQKNIIDSGTVAFEHLNLGQEAMQKGNFGEAAQELQISLNSFAAAQNKLDTIHPIWRSLLYLAPKIGDKLKNGEELMLAGTNLTLGSLPVLYLLTEKNQSAISLSKIKETLDEVAPRFAKTNASLMRVNPDYLPEANKDSFLKIREAIFLLNDDLQKLTALSKSLLNAAGINEEKTYLLIFQNNNEIRATGGFIGSFGELKIKNGKIIKIDIPGEGSYALQGTLLANLIPPAPLQLLQPRWEFRDANWFPDFPTSAKKLMWFYEKSGGPSVDGVIALDTNPLVDLIKILGPLELPKHNLTINAENFIDSIQKNVEVDYDKTKNQPKEVLADLAPMLFEKIFNNQNNLLPLLSLINKNLTQKHIQFFFNDPLLEKDMTSQGWGGELKNNANGDFLSVINTNIGGEKSDRVIEQTIQHEAQILDDGSVIDKVTITRRHLGGTDAFSNAKNNSYVRFFVPQGSQLISASGFVWPEETDYKIPEKWYTEDEDLKKIQKTQTVNIPSGTIITEESGKTVLANWMIVSPKEMVEATITYRLPFKIKKPETKNWMQLAGQFFRQDKNYSSYSLLIQKQAGTNADLLSSTVTWPKNWKTLWTNPSPLTAQEGFSYISTNLAEDRFFGIVFDNSSNP